MLRKKSEMLWISQSHGPMCVTWMLLLTNYSASPRDSKKGRKRGGETVGD